MKYDWVVVGAGLTGATIAQQIATRLDQSVLVVDRRGHIAGNAFDEIDDVGVRVHRYGAHIFHTKSRRVWDYLSQFTSWLPYQHKVLGSIDGHLVPVPFNLTSLRTLLPNDADRFEVQLTSSFGTGARIPVLTLLEHDDASLRELGEFVYEKVFLHYTIKQWGLRPDQIDRSVTSRVPVLVGHDDRYFQDRYQGIPTDGYTAMVARMLDHPRITVALSEDTSGAGAAITGARVVWTGPIDEYFDMAFGPLPYRSLRFETVSLPIEFHQPGSVVNYPNDHAYTRILEHKHFSAQHLPDTTITMEYPQAHVPGSTEPFYPVPTAETHAQYSKYRQLAASEAPDVLFTGRLADYRYYDMDGAVNQALVAFRRHLANRSAPAPALRS